jgi:uncharacterized protein YeaO (DUF488 family)
MEANAAVGVNSLSVLLAQPVENLSTIDIARMNLLAAEGLPGTGAFDVQRAVATLDAWAKRVGSETERHRHRFRNNPAEFEHSEGFFRMLMLAVVLAEDFGVHYKQEAKAAPTTAQMQDGFFGDAQDVFLPGLLGPKRQGTCSSLPVLYVAVGRQLGYPLKLVTTKAHLFVRWEDKNERFNVEAAGDGLNRFDDAYYRQWPFAVTEQDVQAEGYLKSLTPAEELAAFQSIRDLCWLEAGRRKEAAEAFGAAARLAPGCRSYRQMYDKLQSPVQPAKKTADSP